MEKQTVSEVLDKFQNGEQRYDTNAYFKEAINRIAAGLPTHVVLDRVLKEHIILMHLHNEELNRNKVAVAECQSLRDEVKELKGAYYYLHESFEYKNAEANKLSDEVKSLTKALQHFQQ